MVNFTNWIFDRFPRRFKIEDSYKDADGKGLLERMMGVIGDELDEEIIPLIEDYQVQQNPITCDSKFINLIAFFYGNPPSPLSYEDLYRKLLSKITEVNKIKGTEASYVLFFKLIGLDVAVREVPLVDYRYDKDNIRYDNNEHLRYDMNCPPCSGYYLDILDHDNLYPEFIHNPIDPEIFKLLMSMIRYCEPINARLIEVTYDDTPLYLGGSYDIDYSFSYDRIRRR